MNELFLIISLILLFGGVILVYRLFGAKGLYAYSVFATIVANIEVLLIVNAFGMEMTLGNVLFACTFLITDVLSENHGKKSANFAVKIGIAMTIFYVILTQMWIRYIPSSSDWAMDSFRILFANTPRLIAASLIVYIVAQFFDVWLYHTWWNWSTKHFGDSHRALWLRNNGSTMISQLVNAILYNICAFAGTYPTKTLVSIIISTYVIYFVTSLLDTPIVYACRRIHEKEVAKNGAWIAMEREGVYGADPALAAAESHGAAQVQTSSAPELPAFSHAAENERQYAVTIPLVRHDDGPYVLFEKRSSKIDRQPGEICFPGGGREGGETPEQNAIRETCEELQIPESGICMLAQMNTYRTAFANTIDVFLCELKNYKGTYSLDEVECVFEVPLSFFLEHEPDHYVTDSKVVMPDDFPMDKIPGGRDYPWHRRKDDVYFYYYNEWVIWGLTAKIMRNAAQTLNSEPAALKLAEQGHH